MYIETVQLSRKLRRKAIDVEKKAISITNFIGSDQEKDITNKPNCNGFGRIRHFNLNAGNDWVINPLPNFPVAKALRKPVEAVLRTQVFQNSVCNLNCWYCFVDRGLRVGNKNKSAFLTCDEMLDLYLSEKDSPYVIDLTGGQPDLTPEWIYWMMQAIVKRGLQDKIFLWSDDNLTSDYLRTYLTDEQIDFMVKYKNYARVCCFKGFDKSTFSINTGASPELFNNQFQLCDRLINLGFDLYSYLTLVSPSSTNYKLAIPRFIDKVQKINELLPLRIVPLKIFKYTPLTSRINSQYLDIYNGQFKALEVWISEIERRFPRKLIETNLTEIPLNNMK